MMKKVILSVMFLCGAVGSIIAQAQKIDPNLLTPARLASNLRKKAYNADGVFAMLKGMKKTDGSVASPQKRDGWEFMVKWAPKVEGDAVVARTITSDSTWQPPVGDVGGLIGLYYQSHDGQQKETVFEV